MNIDIKDIITLDNANQYVVVSKANYEDETYFYLVDLNDNANFKLLKLNKVTNNLAEFNDEVITRNLLPLLLNETLSVVDINSLITE